MFEAKDESRNNYCKTCRCVFSLYPIKVNLAHSLYGGLLNRFVALCDLVGGKDG